MTQMQKCAHAFLAKSRNCVDTDLTQICGDQNCVSTNCVSHNLFCVMRAVCARILDAKFGLRQSRDSEHSNQPQR